MNRNAVLVLAAIPTLTLVGSGCSHQEYLVPTAILQRAAAETIHRDDTIAVQGTSPDQKRTAYLRYSALDAEEEEEAKGFTRVSVPNRGVRRYTGGFLLGFGGAALISGIAVMSLFLSSSCSGFVDCSNRTLLGLGVGIPLLGAGVGLSIPGAISLAGAFGPPVEVKPGEPNMLYLPAPAPAPR